jgi:Ca2+-binding RTX toxin-like protein
MSKPSLVLLTVVALALAAAAPASALPTISSSATGALYNGSTANDINTLTPLFGPPRFQLSGGPATPGTNCATSGANIICTMLGGDAEMHGDAGDDELYNGIYTAGVSKLYGDAGSDRLFATGNTTWAYGGDGNDVTTTGANGGGANYGQDGNDIVITKSTSLAADGGNGNDLVILNSTSPGSAQGQAGADRVVGLRPGGNLNGGDDDDIVAFSAATGSFGFTGAVLHGNGGADRLYGSAEADRVYGDAGDDLVNAYGDGRVDTVDCGADTDVAYVDAIDTTANCETVVVGSAAPSDPQVSAAVSDAVADAAAAWNAVTPLP